MLHDISAPHDLAVADYSPNAFFLDQEPDDSGAIADVATILLRNRRCPWRCIYCDLWKQSLNHTVPVGAIPRQVSVALRELDFTPGSSRQVKLYNAGSFFDRAAIPPRDHGPISRLVRGFDRVIVECHPALINGAVLQFRDLIAPAHLEVAMGLEIADDALLQKLNKRMTVAMFARAAEFLLRNDVGVRAFVIVKPPFLKTAAEAVAAATHSTAVAFDAGASVVSLIPSRFGTEELDALSRAGEFCPPTLADVETTFDRTLSLRRGRVFVDLWDIDRLVNCPACFAARRRRLHEMNLMQEVLPGISCRCQGATLPLPTRARHP